MTPTTIESKILEQKAELKRENICDACCGAGLPISNLPCMCEGTGKMSEAAYYLRKQLFKSTQENEQLRARLAAFEKLRAIAIGVSSSLGKDSAFAEILAELDSAGDEK